MAYEVDVHGATTKVRRPFAVFIYTTITLGVYGAVWYFRVNRELRDYGAAYGDRELAESKPRNSLLAITLGLLVIVPFFVSVFGFIGRVRRAERIGGGRLTSGWLVAILAFTGSFILLPGFAILAYVQSDLNQLWARYGTKPEIQRPARSLRPPPAWLPTPVLGVLTVGIVIALFFTQPLALRLALPVFLILSLWAFLTRLPPDWRARLWAWLTKGESRPLRPPPGWIFRPIAGWAFFGLTIGIALTPVWPLVLVIIIVLALWVYEDCRAQGFSQFWFPTFAVNLGPPVFLAYIASRSENLAAQTANAPTPEQFAATGHLPPAGWYPDPLGEADTRYWDGARWTQDVRAPAGAAATGQPGEAANLPAPGWYRDPLGGTGSRYWDGAQWTEDVKAPAQAPTPAQSRLPANLPAPGWYPDPLGEAGARYWDGAQWTQDVKS